MYTLALIVHSWLRWVVVVAGVLATASTFVARSAGEPDPTDRFGLVFMASLDLQMLVGLLLYFALSPTTATIFRDFGGAMADPVARFWAVEHISTMLLAVVLVHVGRVLGRRAASPASKRARLMLCFALATLLILAATPWPGMTAGRPLFRV